jgi:hypothetical protein
MRERSSPPIRDQIGGVDESDYLADDRSCPDLPVFTRHEAHGTGEPVARAGPLVMK